MMTIHRDMNNVVVNAIAHDDEGRKRLGHHYQVSWKNGSLLINFQKGNVKYNGVNGVTTESLLAVLIHRTEEMNYAAPCRENEQAMFKMQEALMWLNERTRDKSVKYDDEGDVPAPEVIYGFL